MSELRVSPWPRRALFQGSVWIVMGFVLMPVVFTVWVSFFSNQIVSYPPEGYTTRWYLQAWQLGVFRDGFLFSVEVAVLATLLGLSLGVPAGVAIARGRFPGRETVNLILMSPIMVPAIVSGCAIYLFYVEIEFRGGIHLAGNFLGLVAAHTLITIPWVLRLIVSSLAGMDETLEEASMNLGARRLTTFRRITLPVVRPGIVAASLFSFIVSFSDLEKSLLLVGPGSTTLPIAILNYLENRIDPTIMAVATVQILIIAVALVLSDRCVKLTRTF